MSLSLAASDSIGKSKVNLLSCTDRPLSYSPLFDGAAPDEEVASEHQAKLEAKLDAYEVILAKQKYLGGNVRSKVMFCNVAYMLSGVDARGPLPLAIWRHGCLPDASRGAIC